MKHIVIILSIFTMAIGSDTKIGGTTYFDYTSGKDDAGESTSAFNFKRQYISFSGEASDDIKYKIVVDVGATNNLPGEDQRLTAFLKKAQIDYKTSFAKISMGVIGTNTYGVQEKNWGYRFIEKSAMDTYKFSSTADIGIGFSKSLTDDLNMSLQMVNGEGYKSPQIDKYHKISLNTTYGEAKLHKNDGYNVGLVYSTEDSEDDLTTIEIDESLDPTNVTSLFGGYAANGLRLGVENATKTKGDLTESITSISANYGIKDNMDVFVRYDMYDPNADMDEDGSSYMITGVVFNCGNGLSMAPNMGITSYEDADADSETEYKLNIQYKF